MNNCRKKTILDCISILIIFFAILMMFLAFFVYLMNNAYTVKVINDLVDTLKKTSTLNQDDLLNIERLFELRNELNNIDVSKFLYSIFSMIFLSIGLFVLNQVNNAYEKIKITANDTKTIVDRMHINSSDVAQREYLYQVSITLGSIQTTLLSLEISLINKESIDDDSHNVNIRDAEKFIAECIDEMRINKRKLTKNMFKLCEKGFVMCINRFEYMRENYPDKLDSELLKICDSIRDHLLYLSRNLDE